MILSGIMQIYDIARVCHEANKAFLETQGDYSHVEFDAASDKHKDAAVELVKYILANPVHLTIIGFDLGYKLFIFGPLTNGLKHLL